MQVLVRLPLGAVPLDAKVHPEGSKIPHIVKSGCPKNNVSAGYGVRLLVDKNDRVLALSNDADVFWSVDTATLADWCIALERSSLNNGQAKR